ncbi:MFS family permease [Nonomuraea jabiensis]|uniref:MFS family permease n=1 Tax=Nonomuraea jabiensis TaxID=882448 RepID=A0A7W9GE56_9ACTN|nr:hypothetical protein [Nonomuraea jabiensis]MBB5781988.1 MFS family permease [Nonomuraea jabiensis]
MALVLVLVLVLVPESPVRTGGRFDLTGAAGLSVARPAAAGQPAHCRTPPGAADQPRRRRLRLRHVRHVGIVSMSAIWQLVLASCVIGAGIGFVYGALPSLIMAALPVSETAAANSLNTLMRAIGSSVSSVVVGVVLARMTITFGSAALPPLNGFGGQTKYKGKGQCPSPSEKLLISGYGDAVPGPR